MTPEEMKNALLRSGYLIEQEVENILDDNEYYVDVNQVYVDPDSKVSREYDVEAHKFIQLKNGYSIGLKLFIECENNVAPFVILENPYKKSNDYIYRVKLSGIPHNISTKKGVWKPFINAIGLENVVHYAEVPYSRQYCTFSKKKGTVNEWYAYHDDEHHDSLKKLLYVTKTAMLQHNHFIEQQIKMGHEVYQIVFNYPIYVLGKDLKLVHHKKEKLDILDCNHACLKKEFISGNIYEEFCIDVVKVDYFDKFIKGLDLELEKISKLIEQKFVHIKKELDLYFRFYNDRDSLPDEIKRYPGNPVEFIMSFR